jgi:hypothetical protein
VFYVEWFLYGVVANVAGHVARMWEDRGVYRVVVGKPEGKEAIGETKT